MQAAKHTKHTPTQWMVHVAGLLLLPGALLAGRLSAAHINEGPVICPWRRCFGFNCLGCGMTRALCLLSSGHGEAAIQTNPLIVAVVLIAGVIFLKSLYWLVCVTAAVSADKW